MEQKKEEPAEQQNIRVCCRVRPLQEYIFISCPKQIFSQNVTEGPSITVTKNISDLTNIYNEMHQNDFRCHRQVKVLISPSPMGSNPRVAHPAEHGAQLLPHPL